MGGCRLCKNFKWRSLTFTWLLYTRLSNWLAWLLSRSDSQDTRERGGGTVGHLSFVLRFPFTTICWSLPSRPAGRTSSELSTGCGVEGVGVQVKNSGPHSEHQSTVLELGIGFWASVPRVLGWRTLQFRWTALTPGIALPSRVRIGSRKMGGILALAFSLHFGWPESLPVRQLPGSSVQGQAKGRDVHR